MPFVLAAAVGGCGGEYEREEFGPDSSQADSVRQMVTRLRDGGEAGLDQVLARDAADDLDDAQQRALRAALRELIRADDVRLERLDRFGKDVWRAVFELTTSAGKRTACLLLFVRDGRPRWASPN